MLSLYVRPITFDNKKNEILQSHYNIEWKKQVSTVSIKKGLSVIDFLNQKINYKLIGYKLEKKENTPIVFAYFDYTEEDNRKKQIFLVNINRNNSEENKIYTSLYYNSHIPEKDSINIIIDNSEIVRKYKDRLKIIGEVVAFCIDINTFYLEDININEYVEFVQNNDYDADDNYDDDNDSFQQENSDSEYEDTSDNKNSKDFEDDTDADNNDSDNNDSDNNDSDNSDDVANCNNSGYSELGEDDSNAGDDSDAGDDNNDIDNADDGVEDDDAEDNDDEVTIDDEPTENNTDNEDIDDEEEPNNNEDEDDEDIDAFEEGGEGGEGGEDGVIEGELIDIKPEVEKNTKRNKIKNNKNVKLSSNIDLSIIYNILNPEDKINITPEDDLHPKRNINLQILKTLPLPLKTIQLIEKGIYNYAIDKCNNKSFIPLWDNMEFSEIYISKTKNIYTNLNSKCYVKNKQLIDKIKTGKIDPYELAFLDTYKLFPEIWNDIIEEKTKIEKILKDSLKESATDMFECPRCHKRKTIYCEVQTRSSDEPMTKFITCLECGCKWKKY